MIKSDTLAMHMKRPGTIKRDARDYPMHGVVVALNSYMNDSEFCILSPETEALRFYSSNHVMSEVLKRNGQNTPLGDHLFMVDIYQTQLSQSSVRMFYYLLLICTRESRHVRGDYDWDSQIIEFGADVVNFTKNIGGLESCEAISSFRKSHIESTIGHYTRHLYKIFNTGDFCGGYGGQAWAEVASTLVNFVDGTYSAEVMMDTAFNLCHNNGPIFNKGMLYREYDSLGILKILDVQRSGQIPELIKNSESVWVDSIMIEYIQTCEELLHYKFNNYVDWYKVVLLGALGYYESEKKKQKVNHGVPENLQQTIDVQKVMIANKIKIQNELEDKQKAQYLEIMPGVKVPKLAIARVF